MAAGRGGALFAVVLLILVVLAGGRLVEIAASGDAGRLLRHLLLVNLCPLILLGRGPDFLFGQGVTFLFGQE